MTCLLSTSVAAPNTKWKHQSREPTDKHLFLGLAGTGQKTSFWSLANKPKGWHFIFFKLTLIPSKTEKKTRACNITNI